MTSIKTFVLTSILALAPKAALASAVIIDDFGDDIGAPIPEPTSAFLMMAGFATIIAVRRLRK